MVCFTKLEYWQINGKLKKDRITFTKSQYLKNQYFWAIDRNPVFGDVIGGEGHVFLTDLKQDEIIKASIFADVSHIAHTK